MSLLDRLQRTEEPPISAHYFYGALVGLADGQFTRAQIEAQFSIATTGADKTELDFLISNYQSAANKLRYLNSLHGIFLVLADENAPTLTKSQIQDWLLAAKAVL